MHRPSFYAERFQRFMCNTVFKKIPRKYLRAAVPVAVAVVSGFSLLSSGGLGRWMTACKSIRKFVVPCYPFLPPRLFLPHRCGLVGVVSSISLFFQGTALVPDSSVTGKLLRRVFHSFLNVLEKCCLGFCLEVKPSPSKKSRSGTAVPRRSCQGGVPSQSHMSCETKAQVMTEADVEQGWCLD